MALYLFLLMLLLPVVEIYILVAIGHATSFWVPFAIVIGSMIIGTTVARHEGLRVLERIREDMNARRMPADSIVDAFLILIAGMLLIFPGVLTDIVGIALLIRPLRSLMKRGAKAGCGGMSKFAWRVLARSSGQIGEQLCKRAGSDHRCPSGEYPR